MSLLAGCALALLVAAPRAATAEGPTDGQFLGELDTHVGLGAKTSVMFLFRNTRDEDWVRVENQLGAHLDYAATRDLKLRAGYRFVRSFDEPNEPHIENRAVLEVTPRRALGSGFVTTFRNRVDLRFPSSGGSWRYRPRLQIARAFALDHDRSLTPYVSAEPFYDSRFDTWARWRYQAGVETAISPAVSIDTFYRRQDDRRPASSHLNVTGLVLDLAFD